MSCLWILALLCLCNNGNGSSGNDSEEGCGCERPRRFGNDSNLYDMPRGGESGRMPSNFQRDTCGCEVQEQ